MRKISLILACCAAGWLSGCDWLTNSSENNTNSSTAQPIVETTAETPLFSFAFVGCNRINLSDTTSLNPSTANLPVLKRIFADLDSIGPKPELLFFLGDMVLAENTVSDLTTQLDAWVRRYEDSLKIGGIELVAVPGNHEMLHWGKPEYPLKGATDVWMKYMSPYMPSDRNIVSTDSLNNRATFSFVRHNTAFVVMNTDTYNKISPDSVGAQGLIAFDWIQQKIEAYRKDNTVDHIFVLGHKPAYFNGKFHHKHSGFPDSKKLWSVLRKNNVSAMLSAHKHCYYRGQPGGDSTYQIVAGNGGSSFNGAQEPPEFFGYSVIHVYANQAPKFESIGFKPGTNYNDPIPAGNFSAVRDSTTLVMSANPNKGFGNQCE